MSFDNSAAYASPSPPAVAVDAKSIDGDNLNEYNKQHSINSEDVRPFFFFF